jgi:hypothetical protein
MTEDELRAIVRGVVEQRLAGTGASGAAHAAAGADCGAHPSHARLRVVPGVEAGGPCLIEPRVACTLCGYCQSYGH